MLQRRLSRPCKPKKHFELITMHYFILFFTHCECVWCHVDYCSWSGRDYGGCRVLFVSSHINNAARSAATSAMEVSLTHVAAGMQSLIEANHSAAVVAHSLQIPGNKSSHFRHVIYRASLWFNCAFFFLQSWLISARMCTSFFEPQLLSYFK